MIACQLFDAPSIPTLRTVISAVDTGGPPASLHYAKARNLVIQSRHKAGWLVSSRVRG